jgi:Sulfotransferase family
MPLPTFIIAGERRCGTTSLYRWISSHRDVYLHPRTDLNYFIEDEIVGARKWRDGEANASAWERKHNVQEFSLLFTSANGHSAIGHKGADLLFWEPAHERLARFVPQAKFIIILRNPVTRAWSHYWNEVGKGRENLSFEQAIAAEEERCKRSAYARNHLSYITRGFYDRSLKTFSKNISPSRVMVVTLEETRAHPEETLSKIYKFLDLDPKFGMTSVGTQHNENWTMVPRDWSQLPVIKQLQQPYLRLSESLIVRATKDTTKRRKARRYAQLMLRKPAGEIRMSPETRAKLVELYHPHILALESLLRRQLLEWQQD